MTQNHAALAAGVDPGWEGAAAVLDVRRDRRRSLVYAAVWRPVQVSNQPRLRFRAWRPDEELDGPCFDAVLPYRMSAVGHELALGLDITRRLVPGRVVLGCEAQFVGDNPQSALDLAWTAGATMAEMEQLVDARSLTAGAVTWRPVVLGIAGNTKAEKAKAEALRQMEQRLDGFRKAVEVLGRLDHLAEAACLGWWTEQEVRTSWWWAA